MLRSHTDTAPPETDRQLRSQTHRFAKKGASALRPHPSCATAAEVAAGDMSPVNSKHQTLSKRATED